MKITLIIIAALACAYLLYRVLMLIIAAVITKIAFGRRSDKNPLLKYFAAEDFGLTALPVNTYLGKTAMRGNLYTFFPLEECKSLVIFAHGMGPGQCAYTTEISFFCKNGCAVLAFDDVGCNLSDGKGVKGLENAAKCLAAAVQFATADPRFKGKKIILAGHSMGGYAALCATQFVKADGVVSISAPDSPADITVYLAGTVMGKFAKALKHYIKVVNRIKMGRYANVSASAALAASGTKALVIHGDSDPQVPVYLSAYAHVNCKNAYKMMCAGKKHNPYNTVNAERALAELSSGLAKCGSMTQQQREQFFSSRDYNLICQEDMSVMSAVLDFILTV